MSSKTRHSVAPFSLVLAALIVLPSTAAASPEFTEELRVEFALDCMPSCLICHADNQGGRGTLATDFGNTMFLVGGLRPRAVETIGPALDALDAAGTDSDADGVTDTNELAQATNPNGDELPLCLDGPQYGCGARVHPRGPYDGWIIMFLAMMLAVLQRFRSSQL
jgi:hypothetical protein